MNKLLHLTTIASLLVGLCFMTTSGGYAQTVEPALPVLVITPTPLLLLADEDVVPFSLLHQPERILRGPVDSMNFLFNLPATWELTDGAEIRLDLVNFLSAPGASATTDTSTEFTGSLEVAFNNKVISTVLLDYNGERTVVIPILKENLTSTRLDGRHDLSLTFLSNTACDNPEQSSVVVRNTSSLVFPHETIPPSLDLRRLPIPIFQDTFLPDTVMMVIPNQPTASELQAALAVAAGYGEMTRNKLALSLLPVSELTPDIQSLNHLIFVGTAAAFPELQQVELPAPVADSQYGATEVGPDDGIIQMAVSPWNGSKVVLVVGGNTEVGVVKAGKAISVGTIRVGAQNNLALVSEVRSSELTSVVPVDQMLADLGYEDKVVRRSTDTEYFFFIPPGQAVQSPAYFDLTFSHSELLNYQVSGMTVNLNDQPISSVRLSDETASEGKARVSIPTSLLQPGYNRLLISADVVSDKVCSDLLMDRQWLTIRAESLLHLPMGPGSAVGAAPVFDLSEYPKPFTFSRSLDNLVFVLSPDDPAGWNVASQIAFDLGYKADLTMAEFLVAFGNDVSLEVRQQRNLMIIGRPSQLPIVSELKDALPLPFEAGSDIAIEQNLPVVYNTSGSIGVSYIQLFPSPWDNTRTIVAILGSSSESLQWAGTAMTSPRLNTRLVGNLLIIDDQQIIPNQSAMSDSGEEIATQVAVAVATQAALNGLPPAPDRPGWLLPIIFVVSVLTLALIAFVVGSTWRNQKAQG